LPRTTIKNYNGKQAGQLFQIKKLLARILNKKISSLRKNYINIHQHSHKAKRELFSLIFVKPQNIHYLRLKDKLS